MKGRRTQSNGAKAASWGFHKGPSDPPSGIIDSWKRITLSFELQPGSTSTITTTLIETELQSLGITAEAIRLHQIAAWAMSGTAANQSRPVLELDVRDVANVGSYGKRVDSGNLSVPAHLHFKWPPSVQQTSFATGATLKNIATAEITSSPSGTMNVVLSYLL
jgi:hypothetical protein